MYAWGAQVVEDHKRWISERNLDVKGRIYFSRQGVNAQFGGPRLVGHRP